MPSRDEIRSLASYVTGDAERKLILEHGLEGLSTDRKASILMALQDLGWIGRSGLGDFADSYELTAEGRVVTTNEPDAEALNHGSSEQIRALRDAGSDELDAVKRGLAALVEIQCERGNWDSATVKCNELRTIAGRTKDTRMLAYAYFQQGRVERAQNQWHEALEAYLKAVELYMEAGDRRGVCMANRAMGIVYGSVGDHASAIRCFETSISLAHDIGDWDSEVKGKANLAIVYDLEGRREESERLQNDCLAFFIEIHDHANASRIAVNLGVLNLTKEKFDVAADYFEKGISSTRATGMREILGAALANAGYCFVRTGDLNRSKAYTDEAVSILREPHNKNMLALAYRNYGCIEQTRGNKDAAFDWFERSVRTAKESGVEDTLAACCYEFGMALIISTTKITLARKLLKRASSIYASLGDAAKARSIDSRLASV
jgi:tetratricopeptide (TPR) repeat protein